LPPVQFHTVTLERPGKEQGRGEEAGGEIGRRRYLEGAPIMIAGEYSGRLCMAGDLERS